MITQSQMMNIGIISQIARVGRRVTQGLAEYYSQSHSDRKKNSEERLLHGLVVEDGASAERGRDRLFVGDDRVEVGFGVELGFGRADEAFKAAEAVEFVFVADLCGIEREGGISALARRGHGRAKPSAHCAQN
jgi:hypothetical protein